MIVYLNGQFVDSEDAKISIFDHGFLYGDGVYETLQYKNGKINNLDEHISRLCASAATMMLDVPKIDFNELIHHLIQENNIEHARVRITLTRGENGFIFHTCNAATILITAMTYPAGPLLPEYTDTCTVDLVRILPEVKSTQLLPMIVAKQNMAQKNCQECFFVNEQGEITEGSVSNIFVVKDGMVITPPDEDCLAGTIRKNILDICERENIPYKKEKILKKDLHTFDELFWTNAVVGLSPAKRCNDVTFRAPGKVTNQLISYLDL